MKKEEEKSLPFEENLETLEEIVKDLESGNVPLDEAISKYNEAMKLAKACNDKLMEAEKAIHKVLQEDGTMVDLKEEKE